MVTFTGSMTAFLLKYHRELYVPLWFGHLELFTDEIKQEYIDWCLTDEAKPYLKIDKEDKNT